MPLKHENIGMVAGVVVAIVGSLLTDRDPNQLEGAVIAVLALTAAFWLSYYLHLRDGTYRRSPRR